MSNYCVKCGKKDPEHGRYCNRCVTSNRKVSEVDQNHSAPLLYQDKTKQATRIVIKVLGMSVIAIFVIGVVVYMGSSSFSPPSTGTTGGTTSGLTPSSKGCIHSSEANYSVSEEAQMKSIVQGVMDGDIYVKPSDIYDLFWSITDKYGRICDEDISVTKDGFVSATECNKIFYQDALTSLRMRAIYKSPQRLDCENKTINSLLTPEKAGAQIKSNEELLTKIINQQPIETANGQVVFTDKIIQATISDIGAKLDRLNALLSRIPPPENSNEWVAPIVSQDTDCEKLHGPSVYKVVPGGGGAYCDCKPGYIPKQIITADGTPSSWCF